MQTTPLSRRILSPFHCEEFTESRLNLELQKALELGFNEIHLATPMHDAERGNLDALIEYEGFLKQVNAKRPLHHIRGQRRILDEFTRRARAAGVKVYLWHHELWFPHAVQEAFRKKFVDGIVDPLGPFVRDYLKSRFTAARNQLPYLDGLVLTLAETSQVVYHRDASERDAIALTAAFLQILDSNLKQTGWGDYVLRVFCWEEKEYRILSQSIAQLSKKPVLMAKAVPFDWHLHFPVDPLLTKLRDQNLLLELGTNNEYWGINQIPCPVPDLYIKQIEEVRRIVPNLQGVAARTDRDNVAVWDTPNEINLWAVSSAAHAHKVNGKKLAKDFIEKRYYPKSLNKAVEIMLGAGEVIKDGYYERGRHLNGTCIGTMLGQFGLFQQARHLFFTPEDTSFRKARQSVEARAQRLTKELEKKKSEFSPSDYFSLANSLELLEGMVKANSLTCELLYGLRSSIYDSRWRKNAKWTTWKKMTLELADALEKKFGSDLFRYGTFDQGNVYPGSTPERLRRQVIELPTILSQLERRRKGKELLSKQSLTKNYYGKKCVELAGKTLKLSTKQSKNKQVLVLRAGSEMAINRPLLITWNNDSNSTKKNLGTFGWFKCCNGYRDYEVEIPQSAFHKGKVYVDLASANPSFPVRLASVRFEERLSGVRGEDIKPLNSDECGFSFFKLFKKYKKKRIIKNPKKAKKG